MTELFTYLLPHSVTCPHIA